MQLKSSHTALIATVFFALVLPFGAIAQEDRFSFDSENSPKEGIKQDQETPSGENPDIRTNKNLTAPATPEPAAVVIRDSELKNSKPVPKAIEKVQKEEEKVQKKEEDPLSFNFLYFIIEKFKFSDIVE